MTQAPRGRDHDRARSLAAARLDGPIAPADAAWLDAHLVSCAACAADAAGYEADRAALRGLRAETVEAPRDLWARTAAAIEAESGGSRRRAPRRRRVFGLTTATLAPIAGLAVVAVVVGSALLNGRSLAPEASPASTPIAFAAGSVAVLNRNSDGGFELRTGNLNELCPMTQEDCLVEPSFETAQVAIRPGQDVDAVISPKKDKLVVLQRGSGSVYVVPVGTAKPGHTPVPDPSTPAPTDVPTQVPTATPAVASGSPAVESPDVTGSPVASEPPVESGSPAATETPSDASASPDATATPEATDAPTATPVVVVTPRPDGAIEIASGVIVVDGPATYSPDGSRFAFTARPADGSGGPDVYVWKTDETVARAITDDHRSVFAGWDGADLLVSRVVDDEPSTSSVNPATGEARGQRVRGAWLPTLSPDGTHAVWWDGAVKLAEDGVTWVPDEGRLVAGSWPDAADMHVLTNGRVDGWQVRWDATGTAVAVWVAGRKPDVGRLSLYRVDEATGAPDLDHPMLDDERALGGFTIEPGLLAWSAPGRDSGKTVQVLAWQGDTIGRAELPADGDSTLVQQ